MSKVIPIYGLDGKEKDKIEFDIQGEPKELSPKTYSFIIKVLRQNWRQGTVACKSRGEIAFSGKKPWKQKGTGRARAGTASSPLWRKGGVVFGPSSRVRQLFSNRKQRRLVLNNLLQNLFETNSSKNIYCLDCDFSSEKPSTKEAFNILKNLGLKNKRVILFLPFNDEANFLAFRNIPFVKVFSFDQPNAFDLSNGDCWVFLKKDSDTFKKMVSLWN